MWCDNCLLVFPLRGGAIAWGVFVAAYSLAGSLFLLMRGQFLFFFYPEWFIYGGIGMAVAAFAIINILALSNRSYIFCRVCHFVWPLLIVICGVRGIFMLWELNRGQEGIVWECENGGQQWGGTPESPTLGNGTSFPSGICGPGFHTLFTAFIVSVLVDIVCQIYMWFLNWRFFKRLEHYKPVAAYPGGYPNV